MAENELIDGHEAMSILGINVDELHALVARGEIIAYRSAGTMKFRREKVCSLKSEKGTVPPSTNSAERSKKSESGIPPKAEVGKLAMPEVDMFDGREAMSALGISDSELQTLVANGDLVAYRSAGTMKFRSDNVYSLKSKKGRV